MLYEIHMIKNYPPTNLNRDDTGSPKTCTFGGFRRGRISSQCLKRSWRTSELFSIMLGESGVRTRLLSELVGEELRNRGVEQESIDEIKKKLTGIAKKAKKEKKKGQETEEKDTVGTGNNVSKMQAIYYSKDDIGVVTDIVEKKARDTKHTNWDIVDVINEMMDAGVRPITMDIALFGRMVTSNAFRNVEAAMQVAHAISTHTVNQESDFFTAVDDVIEKAKTDPTFDSEKYGLKESNSVTAMIGDTDFNSCCYYHYASIDTNQLAENLKDAPNRNELMAALLPAIIEIMAYTNPTGKQNGFAGNVMPSLMAVEIKDKPIPVSYVNAFAKPARAYGGKSIIEVSIDKLIDQMQMLDDAYGIGGTRILFAPEYNGVCACAKRAENLKRLIEMSVAAAEDLR